jgi:hypothetical protein
VRFAVLRDFISRVTRSVLALGCFESIAVDLLDAAPPPLLAGQSATRASKHQGPDRANHVLSNQILPAARHKTATRQAGVRWYRHRRPAPEKTRGEPDGDKASWRTFRAIFSEQSQMQICAF